MQGVLLLMLLLPANIDDDMMGSFLRPRLHRYSSHVFFSPSFLWQGFPQHHFVPTSPTLIVYELLDINGFLYIAILDCFLIHVGCSHDPCLFIFIPYKNGVRFE